jgi:hypothetical protein
MQSHYRPGRLWGFHEFEAPRFQDNRHIKVVRLSALRTGRLYPSGNIPDIHFCYRMIQPKGYSSAGRIMSMKISNDTIGNRTRDLPACSTVLQPTAPLRAPHIESRTCILCAMCTVLLYICTLCAMCTVSYIYTLSAHYVPCAQCHYISTHYVPRVQCHYISAHYVPCVQCHYISAHYVPCVQYNCISAHYVPRAQFHYISAHYVSCAQCNYISAHYVPCAQCHYISAHYVPCAQCHISAHYVPHTACNSRTNRREYLTNVKSNLVTEVK